MEDKFLRDKMNNDNIEVPESLLPENVLKKLDSNVKKSKKNRMSGIARYAGSFALAAAAIVVVGIGAATAGRLNSGKNTATDGSKSEMPAAGKDMSAAMEETTTCETMQTVENTDMYKTKYDELYDKLVGEYVYDITTDGGYYIANDVQYADGESSIPDADGVDGMYNENISADMTENNSKENYSKNNDQENGVSEGNIFITDGKYLYILKQPNDVYEGTRSLAIYAADDGELNKCSEITLGMINDSTYIDYGTIYVEQDKLVVTGEAYSGVDYRDYNNFTFAVIYDISDRTAPKYVNTLTQSGYSISSRITDGILYMISGYSPSIVCERGEYEKYIPMYNDVVAAEENIYCPEYISDRRYTVIGSVDLDNPMTYKDTQALVLNPDNMYVSQNAIYFLEQKYEFSLMQDYIDNQKTKSRLIKLEIDKGNIDFAAEAEVCGSADNQFSFSEYNGCLRLVTTTMDYESYEQSCGLYIFDEELNMIGCIDNLAKGESVKSSRFIGDMVYFVTFRNTDPLFAVDVSDPENPVIAYEIKIPGFSEYLHPYGDGRLFGLGYEADETDGRISNVKMSMFDISNPEDIEETDRLQLEAFYSGALYEHRAILVDAEKNLIGFATEENIIELDETGANVVGKLAQIYRLFSYDENEGFVQRIECVCDLYSYDYPRANYIGDYLYIFDGARSIYTYDLKDYSLLGITEL